MNEGIDVNHNLEEVFETVEDCEKGIADRRELIENNRGNMPLIFICCTQIDALENYKAQLLAEKIAVIGAAFDETDL